MTSPNHTIGSLRESFMNGQLSPEEIFKHYQDKISKKNKELNAYLSTFDFAHSAEAVSAAKAGQLPAFNPQAPLAGIPCAIKDNVLIAGTVATAASRMLANYV